MNYRDNIKTHKRIIVKVGTTSLTYTNGRMDLKRIDNLAWVLSDLRNQGKDVVLVSSGAIAVGADRLNLSERPRDIIGKQAASAVGQAVLMQIYENFFMKYNQKVAQILLTNDVFEYPSKRRNAKNTIIKLLEMGVIPIVNENDTVATEELHEISDNDTLSAYVCSLVDGDILVILSDIDGMYTKDPKKNADAEIISVIDEITREIKLLAGESASSFGTGGMITKVSAAEYVNSSGADMVIASGNRPEILFDILNGKSVGTLFSVKREV